MARLRRRAPQGQRPGQRHRSRCASRTRQLGVLGGAVQPGWGRGIPRQGNIAPQSLRPTRASLQPAKSWGEEDPHLGALRGLPTKDAGCAGLSPSRQHPPAPRASFPAVWERNSLERNKSQRHDYFSSHKWLRDSSWEQDHQGRDAQLLDPQDSSYTFSPFPYWFNNTPASLFHPPLCSRLELCGAASSALGRISSS